MVKPDPDPTSQADIPPENLDRVASAENKKNVPAVEEPTIKQQREAVRTKIAMHLVWLTICLAVAPFTMIAVKAGCIAAGGAQACEAIPTMEMATIMQAVFPPVIALVGAATGFYFGERKG